MERHHLIPLVQPQAFGKNRQIAFHRFWNSVSYALSGSLSLRHTIQCSQAWSPSAYSTFQWQDALAPSPRKQEESFLVDIYSLVPTISEFLLRGCQKSERDTETQDSQSGNDQLEAYMTKQDATLLSFPSSLEESSSRRTSKSANVLGTQSEIVSRFIKER